MIAKTAAAATNSFEVPVIGDYPFGLLEQETHKYRLTFPIMNRIPLKSMNPKNVKISLGKHRERLRHRIFRYDRQGISGGRRWPPRSRLHEAEQLGPLASRYSVVESLLWKPATCLGIDIKVLLEGCLVDDEGETQRRQLRPAAKDNRHIARV